MKTHFKIYAKVWLYPGDAGWYFVTLPKKQSEIIKQTCGKAKRGWGSIPVTVTIGKTSWNTSVFPDKKAGAYLLPLKFEIRKKENISTNDTIYFVLDIRV